MVEINSLPAGKRRSPLGAFVCLLCCVALGLTAGCGGGSSSSSTSTGGGTSTGNTISQPGWTINTAATVQPSKAWTFLVYMNGANDLDSYGLFNFNQMETVGTNANVNIVCQFKRGQGTDPLTGYTYDTSEGGWAGTRRYLVTKDTDVNNINSTLLSTNATADMGSYQTLQAFVQWGIQTYPAQHYCLVVWDHGSGWRSEPIPGKAAKVTGRAATVAKATGRGVSFDEVSQDYIQSTQLSQAISMGNGKKWDLVAWDASLMQMIENDYQIKDTTNYIVGSEESPPGGGYPYDQILTDLTANPSWDGKALGTDFAQKTLAYYQTSPVIVGAQYDSTYITQSVIDASQLAAIAPAVNTLGSTLLLDETSFGTQIALARSDTEQYGVYDVQTSDPTYQFYRSYRDPVDFVHQMVDVLPGQTQPLISDPNTVAAANAARTAFETAVVYNVFGNGHANSHGLSMYIPTPGDYAYDVQTQAEGGAFGYGTNISYGSLAFVQAAPNWLSFLANASK